MMQHKELQTIQCKEFKVSYTTQTVTNLLKSLGTFCNKTYFSKIFCNDSDQHFAVTALFAITAPPGIYSAFLLPPSVWFLSELPDNRWIPQLLPEHQSLAQGPGDGQFSNTFHFIDHIFKFRIKIFFFKLL